MAGEGCAIQTRMLLPLPWTRRAWRSSRRRCRRCPTATRASRCPHGPAHLGQQRETCPRLHREGRQRKVRRLALGGGRPTELPKGWYVEPTLFTDVDNSMTIAQEEIFGPVLVAIPFENDDDAVRIANDSVYGLSGGVFSGIAGALSGRRRAGAHGTFCVNGGMPIGQADMPFGGYKHSGIGRQKRTCGFEQYLETKSVVWPTPRVGRPGRAVSDHDPVLREHGYHSLRIAGRPRDPRCQLFRPRRARRPCRDLPLPTRASPAPSGSTLDGDGAAALVLHVECARDGPAS